MTTQRDGHWEVIGSGVHEYAVSRRSNDAISDEDTRPSVVRRTSQAKGPASVSPHRTAFGLTTPPPSERKKPYPISPQCLNNSYLEYDYKLKGPDADGRNAPRIVFRWYNEDSQGLNTHEQIRAGMYRVKGSIIPPPLYGKELEAAFLSHLTPEKTLSPFISTFENFLPALQRALKSQRPAYIAIIDLRAVEKSLRRRFPEAAAGKWPIRALIKEHGFKLKNNYKGYEWLVHGMIDNGAIIQTVRVSDLRELARSGQLPHMQDVLRYIVKQQHAFGLLNGLPMKMPKTGPATGRLVGMVLDHVEIPKKFKTLLARKIRNMMQFGEHNSRPREQAYLRGVHGVPATDSDNEMDSDDDFIDDDTHEDDGDAPYGEAVQVRNFPRRTVVRTRSSSPESVGSTESLKDDEYDEQAQLNAQLHATLQADIEAHTIATDILRAAGIHPTLPPLNWRTNPRLLDIQADTIDLTGDATNKGGNHVTIDLTGDCKASDKEGYDSDVIVELNTKHHSPMTRNQSSYRL